MFFMEILICFSTSISKYSQDVWHTLKLCYLVFVLISYFDFDNMELATSFYQYSSSAESTDVKLR